jgi:hypothetical protein
MAEPARARAEGASKPQAVKKKAPKDRLDLSTLGGVGIALAGIIGGLVLEKGSIQDIAQGTAAMIVLGGTLGAVMVTTPLSILLRAFGRLGEVLFEPADTTAAMVESIIQYATKARKNGIVSLETEASSIADPFLRKALNLAVDGTDLQELRKMMEIDIAAGEQSSEAEAKVRGERTVSVFTRTNASQLDEIGKLIDAGKVNVLVSETVPLESARRAHELLENGGVRGKVVLAVVKP